MSYEPLRQQTVSSAIGREIDVGLQAHMRNVYNTMCWGLAATGITAFICANVPAITQLVLYSPLSIVFALAPLVFLWFGLTPRRMMNMPASKVRSLFTGFCVLMGVSFTYIFALHTGASIARVFFITSAMFASMSLYGYTTKKDLSGMGHFLIMGAAGLFFAMIVNMFMHSPMVDFIVSAMGVVIFTGLAAWETQTIKETYAVGHGSETNDKLAIVGALQLYMSFINLFQFLMSFMGRNN